MFLSITSSKLQKSIHFRNHIDKSSVHISRQLVTWEKVCQSFGTFYCTCYHVGRDSEIEYHIDHIEYHVEFCNQMPFLPFFKTSLLGLVFFHYLVFRNEQFSIDTFYLCSHQSGQIRLANNTQICLITSWNRVCPWTS